MTGNIPKSFEKFFYFLDYLEITHSVMQTYPHTCLLPKHPHRVEPAAVLLISS